MDDFFALDQWLLNDSGLSSKIDSVLDKYFVFLDDKQGWGKKIPRGYTHRLIAKELNISPTNKVCLKINDRFKARGARVYINTGRAYFGNVLFKEISKV